MKNVRLVIVIPVIALLLTVFLPFVNTPTLWFGLPSIMIWTAFWVTMITVALAVVEFGTPHPEDDEPQVQR